MADDAANEGAAAASAQDQDPSEQLQVESPAQEPLEPGPDLPEPALPELADERERGHREPPSARRRRSAGQRRSLVWLIAAGASALVLVDIFFIIRALSREREAPAAPTPSAVASAPPAPVAEPAASVAGLAAQPAATEESLDEEVAMDFHDEGGQDEPKPSKPAKRKHFASVLDAALHSCSTSSVDGLSRQIIEQSRCINPKAVVRLPSRPNLVLGEQVFPYLEAAARDQLTRALDKHRDKTMTINSALRTVAQQYLVWRWSANRRCGVPLATPPGESNHESGLALDIAEQAAWRSALEAHEFRWLGASDRVHFDFKGSGATPQNNTDVLAFQQLWNRNHPNDKISESGRYGPATEQRLKKAPADGFPLGASCAKGRGVQSAGASKNRR